MSNEKCLIIIDVQVGIFNLKNKVFREDELIGSIQALIQEARKRQYAIIFTQHENKSFLKKNTLDWEIVAELEPSNTDIFVMKTHPSIFKETRLEQILDELKSKKITICGLITNGCIKQACIEALERGYDVTLIVDAHSTFNKNPEKVINEWNGKLEEMGVKLRSTQNLFNRMH
jgi:nicotinamidase-related amidase